MNKYYSYFKFFFASLFLAFSVQIVAKPFVVGSLWTGQLGNQFFEIAAAYSLALDNDAEPLFPDLASKTIDGIPTNYKKVFFRLDATKPQQPIQVYYKEPDYSYNPLPFHPNMCLIGYFQSEKYFVKHKKKILELFAPSAEIREYLEKKYGELLKNPKSVAVHMRFYLREDPEQKIYPTYGREYVEKAMMKFPEDSVYIVCSNSIEWARKNLEGITRKIVFIEDEPYYHDLYLMSMCKHNIISNSSFSWWAAYLNPNPDKIVIAPPAWNTPGCGLDYKDVVPEGWVVLR